MNKIKAYNIRITGLVQGVGFRPFIYRLAKSCNLTGWVNNSNQGVLLNIQGKTKDIEEFVNQIPLKAPKNSIIQQITKQEVPLEEENDFRIIKSENSSEKITLVSPDIAVCDECLHDMKNQEERLDYPFTNCTNCGPRFSIIKDIPYDRDKTTMADFAMCGFCKDEYNDIENRRFHAQPVACNECGPHYTFISDGKKITDIDKLLDSTAEFIEKGKIIAFKGMGGYNLVCNAFDEDAVKRLRSIKKRDNKPFAVMFSDIDSAKEYTYINSLEQETLLGWQRPIVILEQKKEINDEISKGLNTLGVMLPYLPLHFQLFEKLKTRCVIFTSGNLSDEPIVIDDDKALDIFKSLTNAVIINNREIYNRVDDSVVRIINNAVRVVRRSRGYAPFPVFLQMGTEDLLACGAELKNTFCIGKESLAIMSQHIGDLKNLETLEFYEESIERFKRLFKFEPRQLVSDMHPQYLSTKYADESGINYIQVQHHHAHIASCMAEHNLDEKVIGISFDGTGYGDDGHIWGGEFFVCDLNEYSRELYFDYTPIPGGDIAVKEPWRMAFSYLYKAYKDDYKNIGINFFDHIEPNKIELVKTAIDKKINSPLTSSIGRLFDGVSALLNICHYSSFEAEAPIRLESTLDNTVSESYSIKINNTIDTDIIIKQIVEDIRNGVRKEIISAKFHNAIVDIILAGTEVIKNKTGIDKVVLSGGFFQNSYILTKSENSLKKNLFNVYSHKNFPTNDGGVALGQLAIAAKRRKLCV